MGSFAVALSECKEILVRLKALCFSNKHHKLTQYTMQKNNVHLPPSYLFFFFINKVIGESPFRFCDIFYGYFQIKFKNYFVIWFSPGTIVRTPLGFIAI